MVGWVAVITRIKMILAHGRGRRRDAALLVLLAWLMGGQGSLTAGAIPSAEAFRDLSPVALAASPDGRTLYAACATGDQVLRLDVVHGTVTGRWPMPPSPSGLALSADGRWLAVACAATASTICVIDTASGKTVRTLAGGYTAMSPVLSSNSARLFVCNRFNDSVSVLDVARGKELARVEVAREPVLAALTRDERFLLVANHLPKGRADVSYVAATVSVIDLARRQVVKELRLPNGSINLRQISVSPDGRYACLALTQARFQLPVTQLSRGWVNTSVLTLIDLGAMDVLNSVVLDEVLRGAANPWATGWSGDGRWLCVTHAGTHELSIIDFPGLLAKLVALPGRAAPVKPNQRLQLPLRGRRPQRPIVPPWVASPS